MNQQVPFNSLLVPTDFSENAWSAFEYARQLVGGEDAEIVVVHAIDPAMVQQLVDLGMGAPDELMASMKKNALSSLSPYAETTNELIQVDTLVSEGDPFLEIILKADDFAVDAIVMSKLGQRSPATSLLFGSIAEKVIRGSRKPVIVLPSHASVPDEA